MTVVLIGAAVVFVGALLLLLREAVHGEESVAVVPRVSVPVPRMNNSSPPDGDDLTKVTTSLAAPRLPRLGAEDDQDNEDGGEDSNSKALTIYEGVDEVDEPTGPVDLILLHAVGHSDVGKSRQRNEDRYLVMREYG